MSVSQVAKTQAARKPPSQTSFERIACPVHDGGDANCSTWYDKRGRLRAKCWSHDCSENEILVALDVPPIAKSAATQERDDARQTRVDPEAKRRSALQMGRTLRRVVKTSDGGLTITGQLVPRRPRLEFDKKILREPFSLEILAQAKQLPVAFLQRECRLGRGSGLTPNTVRIGYYDLNNQLILVRHRSALIGDRFRSPRGVKSAVYGEWRLRADLERTRGELYLVEGESDCWTHWYAGNAALGVPGASCAGVLRREHFVGVRHYHIVGEPGAGGEAFVRGVTRRLQQLGVT